MEMLPTEKSTQPSETTIQESLELLQARLERLEKWHSGLSIEQLLDHRGIAVVAGEGLRGGGVLDKSLSLGFAYNELEVGRVRLGKDLIPFWSDGQHQVVRFEDFVADVNREGEFSAQIEELWEETAKLWEKISLLSLYDRLERAEKTITDLKEELEDAKRSRGQAEEGGEEKGNEGGAG